MFVVCKKIQKRIHSCVEFVLQIFSWVLSVNDGGNIIVFDLKHITLVSNDLVDRALVSYAIGPRFVYGQELVQPITYKLLQAEIPSQTLCIGSNIYNDKTASKKGVKNYTKIYSLPLNDVQLFPPG